MVPSALVDALREPPGNTELTRVGNVAMLKKRPEMSYKSYWYQVNDGQGSLEALGIFGQHIYINPTAEVTIVQLASYKNPGPNAMNWAALVGSILTELKAR